MYQYLSAKKLLYTKYIKPPPIINGNNLKARPAPKANTIIGSNIMPTIIKNGYASVKPNNFNINLRPENINLNINEKAKAPIINIKIVVNILYSFLCMY